MRGYQNLPVLRFQHHLQTLKGRPVHVGPSLWLRSSFFNNFCRCLDAAHGAGRNPVAPGERMCTIRSTGKETGMQVARNPRRRSPHVAAHADFRQGSRVTVAVARSRRFGAIARRNAAEGEQNNSEFTTLRLSESKDRLRALPSKSKVKPRRGLIQNAKFTINGFSSRVRFQRCHSEEQSRRRMTNY